MEQVKGAYLEAKAADQAARVAAQVASANLTQARKALVAHLKEEAFEEWKAEQNLSSVTSIVEGDVRASKFSQGAEPHSVEVAFVNNTKAQWHPFSYNSHLISFTVDGDLHCVDIYDKGKFRHPKKRPREAVNEVLEDAKKIHSSYRLLRGKRQDRGMYPENYIK